MLRDGIPARIGSTSAIILTIHSNLNGILAKVTQFQAEVDSRQVPASSIKHNNSRFAPRIRGIVGTFPDQMRMVFHRLYLVDAVSIIVNFCAIESTIRFLLNYLLLVKVGNLGEANP